VQEPFDVVGIGNALVDVIAHADDGFLDRHGLVKGSMELIDTERADTLYAAMGPGVEVSGGSAANTLAGLASLGGRGAFVGRVRDDQLGAVFAHDIRAVGVAFEGRPATQGSPTGRCLILVTPDAERTMGTYLGASSELGPDDVDAAVVAAAQITFLEGYLFETDAAKAAFREAASAARGAGRKVALTLSDRFCVERHRDEFRELVARDIDILFANEQELLALYETDDLDGGIARAAEHCAVVVATRSARGSVVVAGDERHEVPAHPVDEVVDTTGAGDLYAAGFLYGFARGRDLRTCARLGGVAAAEVISHLGARPERPLSELAAPILAKQ
jgi:sugar/nucleoside kinase (ribokinase family)